MKWANVTLLVCVLAANLLIVGGPGARSAYACSCAGPQSSTAELESSDAVFVGEAVKSGLEDPDPGDNAPFGGIRFDVARSWKGVSEDSVNIYGQGSSYYGPTEDGEISVESSCAVDFDMNKEYLVFASRVEGEGVLQANACSQTSPVAAAGDTLGTLGPPEESLPDTGGVPLSLIGVVAGAALVLTGALVARRGGGER